MATRAEVDELESVVIPGVERELRLQTEKLYQKDKQATIDDREVTIMGDRELPYSVLKKVMASCTEADYGKISLAVLQKSADPGDLRAQVR